MKYLIIALSILVSGCATTQAPVEWTLESAPTMESRPDPRYQGNFPMACIKGTDICSSHAPETVQSTIQSIMAHIAKSQGQRI